MQATGDWRLSRQSLWGVARSAPAAPPGPSPSSQVAVESFGFFPELPVGSPQYQFSMAEREIWLTSHRRAV